MINNRGRRYDGRKLNLKKVFALILVIVVIIMSIFVIKGALTKGKDQGKIASKDYAVIFKDNKWGVIDSTGNIVIDPSYEEMITIPNSKNDVFLCVYDVNYETGEYKTKVLNSKNQEILTQYEQVEAIANQDANYNVWYEDNVLKVKKDGKYGIVNLNDKKLTEIQYDEIVAIEGIKGILKVTKDGKQGIIDNEGKEIIPTQVTEVTNLGKDSKEGFIIQGEDGKYGVVDYSNQVVLEAKYDEIAKIYRNDMYVVKQAGKQVLIKKDGTEVLNSKFDEVKEILKNADNGIIYTLNGKYGVMKTTGEIIVAPDYEELKEAKTGILITKQNGKYGIMDLQKVAKVEPTYVSITYNEKADLYVAEKEDYTSDIIDNTFMVRQSGILTDLDDEKGYIALKQGEEYKYYNFKFEEKNVTEIQTNNTLFKSKQDGKYGFVDKDGKVVVDYQYDDVTEQNKFGFAGIKKDGKWGSIDNKGNIVQEPTYDLEDYLKIDFIGRWHLGKDINMNYYNQL
ncbi:MAG: WG repeat-containing protein [Clostridia bacterium]|nr:WG repeat-containing protein [Clostridia bacterium]